MANTVYAWYIHVFLGFFQVTTDTYLKMKVVLVAAVVLVLAAFCSETQATEAMTAPSACCFSYQTQRIPMRAIKQYSYTSSKCSMPALVIVTKKGREVCVNPEDDWVQNYLKSPKKATDAEK
nr:PREDICTED: C-C motif chemokine 5-like [Latimeria chalumnae]|eukprot:XP_014342821.1 PREDICTED: C-C motif chemokine 5-like [Latimeria chalumnae]